MVYTLPANDIVQSDKPAVAVQGRLAAGTFAEVYHERKILFSAVKQVKDGMQGRMIIGWRGTKVKHGFPINE